MTSQHPPKRLRNPGHLPAAEGFHSAMERGGRYIWSRKQLLLGDGSVWRWFLYWENPSAADKWALTQMTLFRNSLAKCK